MKRRTVLLFTLAAVLAVACSDVLGGNNDNFSFDSMAIEVDSSTVEEATVVSVLRNLQINGVMLLPHACFQMRGDYRRDGGDILFTASAVPTNVQCPQQPAAVQYRVNTFGTGSGTFRVTVYHNIQGTAPRIVTQTTVTVN